jgi:signal transduction histidine kinase
MINSFKKHHLAPMIDAERHRHFMKEALPHLIGGLMTGLLLYVVFLEFTGFKERTIWLIAQAIILMSTVIFYCIYYFYPTKLSLNQWEKVINHISLLWGLIWSLPPHILLLTADNQYVAALLVLTIALTITPAPAMVQYPLGYFAFITLPLLSLFIKLIILDINLLLIFFIPFFWLTVLAYGWRLHTTIIDSIQLRIELDASRKEAEITSIAKSKFLAAVSHDLRQPLQAINLFISALKGKVITKDQNEITNESLLFQRLESSTDNMAELLNSLLDASKLNADIIRPKPKNLDLENLLTTTISEYDVLTKEKNITFNIQTTNVPVFVDPRLFERVIGNLLNNALRYTEHGDITLESMIINDTVEISISDTGIGIPAIEHASIFTEFHQVDNSERNQKKGLGLGLSIVKRLCDLQDWPMSLTSSEGAGSRFTIIVPLGDLDNIKEDKKLDSSYVNFNQENIVIVEDNDQIRSGLESLLKSWNCNTLSFSTAQECLDNLSTHSTIPDLILSDYRLKNNETGIELIKKIRKQKNNIIPAIIITGETGPEQLIEAKQSGFIIIHKPIKAAILRRVMTQAFIN